jgi:hypothetical protein
MDPYIEACGLWGDFHDDLIAEIKRTLARAAPDRYLIRTGERSYLVLVKSEGKKEHPFVPDVGLTTTGTRKKPPRRKGGAAVAELPAQKGPLVMRAFVTEEHRETFVEIYEATPEQRLVTCIEVLSPSNKRPGTEGWDLYLRKRQSLLLGRVNLVEIDLLRGGTRMPMLDPWPDSPYTLLVARAGQAEECLVWPAHFQSPLPTLLVPLDRPDADLPIDLQPMIDDAYQRGRYDRSIDYRQPLTPPLDEEEAAWFEQQLQVHSRNA